MGRKKKKVNSSVDNLENIKKTDVFYSDDPLVRRLFVQIFIPIWLILLVLALSPFTGDPSAPIKNFIISTFGVFASIAVIWIVWNEKRKVEINRTISIILGGYLAILLISTLFAYNKRLAISELVLWITLCAIALFIHILVKKEVELEWILLWVVIATGLSSVYGFFQKFGIDPFPWSTRNVEEYRGLPSSYANPNFAGHALLFGVITSFALSLFYLSKLRECLNNNEKRNIKNLKWLLVRLLVSGIAFILTLSHLYLTRMRSARIALLMALLFSVFFLLWGRRWQIKKLIGFLLGTSALGVIGIVISFYILSSVGAEKPLPFDNSLNLRLNGYYGAVKMILEKPILGFGPGNYKFANIPYWTNYEKLWFTLEKKRNYHVHCDPLEVLIDAGIFGGVFYFGMLLLGILGGIYLYHRSTNRIGKFLGVGVSAVFVAFATDAIFGFNMRVPVSSAFFFLFLGLSQFEFEDVKWKLTGRISRETFLIVLVVSIITMLYQGIAYYADMNLQKARGGIFWAQEYERRGQPQSHARLLDKALEFAETGLKYKSYDPRFSEIPGRICMMKNDYKNALEHLDRALSVDPYNPELWTTRTQCCLNWVHYANNEKIPVERGVQSVLDEAEKSAELALKYNDRYPDAYEGMARTLYFKTLFLDLAESDRKNLYSRAIEYGKKALENGVKESLSLLQILVACYQGLKDYEGCADVLQRALSIDMENIELWSKYATVMKQLNYPAGYLTTLEKVHAKLRKDANKTAPTLAQLALMIYQERARRGESKEKATAILADTLRLNPGELSTWGAYTYAIQENKRLKFIREQVQRLGNTQKSIPELVTLLSKPEDEINWLYVIKEVLNSVNNDEKNKVPYKTQVLRYSWIAEICFNANVNTSSSDKPEIYAHLAELYLKLRFQSRALPCFQFAKDVQGTSTRQRMFYLWAETLFKLKKYEEALEKIRESLKLNSDHVQSRVLLVQILLELNRVSEANLEYEALKQVLPENSATMRSLQQMFENKKHKLQG